MKKFIKILVTQESLIAAVANAQYMFLKVNEFLQESGKPPIFDVKLVSASSEKVLQNGHFKVEIDEKIQDVNFCDLLIIPPQKVIVKGNLIPWIKHMYKKGASVAGISEGVYLLAETGLLSNGSCFVPVNHKSDFQSRFPDIDVLADNTVTEYKRVYTGGDTNSYWNILTYLVQKYIDKNTAILTYRYFKLELGNQVQSSFLVLEGSRDHQDEVILKVQEFIEKHYERKISIHLLSQIAALTNRTLQRRFKKATHYTILNYIQKTKIEICKKLLEENNLSINEIMNRVGYEDPKAFREVFKKLTGLTPMEYKKKYRLPV